MYEFLCERIIPGCTYVEKDEDRLVVQERSAEHLRDHHSTERELDQIRERVINDAMIYLPR